MSRRTFYGLTPWLLVGVLAAMLVGVIEAFAASQLYLARRGIGRLFPRGWFE